MRTFLSITARKLFPFLRALIIIGVDSLWSGLGTNLKNRFRLSFQYLTPDMPSSPDTFRLPSQKRVQIIIFFISDLTIDFDVLHCIAQDKSCDDLT
jgi:hypothetical protein